jgi:uncharacterized membrane protein
VLSVVLVVGFVLCLGAFALFMLICTIIACIKAFGGETWRVPVIGRFAERFA